MVVSRTHTAFRGMFCLLAFVLLALPQSSLAQAVDKADQGCINTMNKSGQKVAKTQGKGNSKCIKSAGAGKLTATAEACLTADAKNKVSKAQGKTVAGQTKKCGGAPPSFGFAGAAVVNAAAVAEELSLLHDIYGADLDAAVLTDKPGAGCQSAVAKAYEKFAATRGKQFVSCKKGGLKDGVITDASGLEACVSDDAKNKVSKARGKIVSGIDKKCVGVNLATAFPGECQGATGTNQALADCIAEASDCRMCTAINAYDALNRACDTFDNGLLDGSCRQCGNGFTEAPEVCDDSGNSASCDSDCTTAVCGDGFVNTAASETCDDSGESATCDVDCSAAVCQDGTLNTTAGEVCDDGAESATCDTDCTLASCGDGTVNATAGEQCDDAGESATCDADCSLASCGDGTLNTTAGEACDNGGANSDVTPDACRSNCQPASCGDGVTDSGEQCDDAGESASCDADCTVASCGDGTLNTSAGEVCDDGGANSDVAPDACRTSCQPADCGDGVTDSGEQCDDAGESATCDADCTVATCGDGTVNSTAGETCDDAGESAICDIDCSAAACGDGVLNTSSGEECDDGNTTSGDGCNATCQCGVGSGEGGCQDAKCPNRSELILYAGTTGVVCATAGDCPVGSCDTGLGRCVTSTRFDTGFTGTAHGADINDQVFTVGNLICTGPFDGLAVEPCGECSVAGLNPDPGYCRCRGDNRTICDQPFAVDNTSCGGNICDCYSGAPLPLSAGNTPVCVVNRFFDDISGTANVDAGSAAITSNLRAIVHLGENLVLPCPACGGSCTGGLVGAGCATDFDCDTGLGGGVFVGDGICSNFDATANDGLRGGTCFKGLNDGASCDIGALHESFPAPGGSGAGLSLDCFPSTGLNVSGTGLKITLAQTTGTSALPAAAIACGFQGIPGAEFLCPCGQCEDGLGDFTPDTCTSDADCVGIGNGTCSNPSNIVFPNDCDLFACTDIGGGRGECTTGPDDGFCDGILLSNGSGFIGCNTNADCAPVIIGLPGGSCTLLTRRSCFLDPITGTGTADPNAPIGVAAFCIARTGNAGINVVAGLPGPARVVNATSVTTFCTDGVTAYTPGVGGCP